VEFSGGFG